MRLFKFELSRGRSDRSRRARRAIVQILVAMGAIALLQRPAQAPGPELSVFPGSIDFGEQRVGAASQPRTATIANLGPTGATPKTVSLEGTGSRAFLVAPGCTGTELLPRGECDISIRFQPPSAGNHGATLRVVSEDGSSDTVRLSGTGTISSDVTVAPSSLQFGAQAIDTVSEPRSFSLSNRGATTVSIIWGGPRVLAGFRVDPDACLKHPLRPGEDCQVDVRLGPAAGGATRAGIALQKPGASDGTARLSLVPLVKGKPSAVALIGSGTTPEPALLTVRAGDGGRVTSRPGGISCPGDCTLSAPAGTEVELNAEPAPGWEFAGWSSTECGSSPACRVLLSGGTTSISAHFTQARGNHELTVFIRYAPNCPAQAIAQVTSDPPGISCVNQPTKPALAKATLAKATLVTPALMKAAMTSAHAPKTATGGSAPPGVSSGCSASFPGGKDVHLTARLRGQGAIELQAPCEGGNECVLHLNSEERVVAQICANPP